MVQWRPSKTCTPGQEKNCLCVLNHTATFGCSQSQKLLIFISSVISPAQYCYSAHDKACKIIVCLLRSRWKNENLARCLIFSKNWWFRCVKQHTPVFSKVCVEVYRCDHLPFWTRRDMYERICLYLMLFLQVLYNVLDWRWDCCSASYSTMARYFKGDQTLARFMYEQTSQKRVLKNTGCASFR